MNSDDDFKQVLKKFDEVAKIVHKIQRLENFLRSDDIKYANITISYGTETSTKKILLTDEKWGVLDSLHRDLAEYKREFMKAMKGCGEE